MSKVSVYILCFNEERKIEDAIRSVIKWADEVLIVDSFSTDRTLDICRRFPVKIIQIPFEGFGKLRNEAILSCTHPWIFSLDADERCTHEVSMEIREIVKEENADGPAAYYISRSNFFLGRWIRYSGWNPDYRQPQLFKKDRFSYTPLAVHERYVVNGKIGIIKNQIWQVPFIDFEQMIQKANRYSTLGAQQLLNQKKGSITKAIFHGAFAFFQTYFIKRGFLDGRAGFLISIYNGISSFYKYAKLRELQKGLKYNSFKLQARPSLYITNPQKKSVV